MIKLNMRLFGLIVLLAFIAEVTVAQVIVEKKIITIPAEVIVDKIRGGMLGQFIGNIDGMPHENKYYDQAGEVQTYIPSLAKGAETDDDTDFEWVYIYNMQKERTAYLPYDAINNIWTKSINRGIWCSNRYARYLMDLGVQPPMTGNVVLNPWAGFNVSGQFLCETFGLVAPAMPQTAASIGLYYTRVAIEQEPAQTTQLFTTMISSAFISSDINKLLDSGVASLDPKSIMVRIIADVRKWHKGNPANFKETRRLIHSKYKLKDALTRNRNGSELNTAVIIAALLYGNGDFAETIRYGMNFGYDADCNCATLGTIVGTIYGYRQMMSKGWQIVDRYQNTKRDNMPMDETMTSFADRVIELFEMVNQENGGRKYVLDKVVVYDIPVEQPASVLRLYSPEEQKQILIKQFEKEIVHNLLEGNRQEMARAAYMAICMGSNTSLANKYPQKWKDACFNLSGYWKVINNIFNSDNFQSLLDMKAKFIAAGFGYLEKVPDSLLYMDMETWKDPKMLYSSSEKSK